MKQESKRVNVPDLRDLIEFWEMKGEIYAVLKAWYFERLCILERERRTKILFAKIESISKGEAKMNRPEIAQELIEEYADADFGKEYLGYWEIPQEDAKELALYVLKLESIYRDGEK